MTRQIQQGRHRHPDGLNRFAPVERGGCLVRDFEDESGHHDRAADDAPGPVVSQAFGEVVTVQLDAAFLAQFAERCVQQVGVRLVAAAARERPVPGPGVAFSVSAAHEQD